MTINKQLLVDAQNLLDSFKVNLDTPLQQRFDMAASMLLPIWQAKKIIEDQKIEALKPARTQERIVKNTLDPDLQQLQIHEFLLKEQIKSAYEDAMRLAGDAHKAAVDAQARGDMEAVKQATIDSYKYSLKNHNNIMFRQQNSYEITDLSKVPREFYRLDAQALQEKLDLLDEKEQIPGVKRIKKLVVVVKDS